MTTNVHDTPLKLCRSKPEFAVELAGEILNLPIPEHGEVLAFSESVTDVEVRDLNADNVVVCREEDRNRLTILEALMKQETYPYQSKLLADFKAEGESNALLIVIESRGLQITEDQRHKIEDCQDLNELNSWLKLAATAPTVKAIIG